MNPMVSIPQAAAEIAAFARDSLVSLLKTVIENAGLLTEDSSDSQIELVMSGLAGVAAGLTVAILLTIYFRTGYRSIRDIVRHGLAAAGILGLLAFVAYDMGHAALAYLGIATSI